MKLKGIKSITELKVGGINYRVVLKDLEEFGKTDFSKNTIFIDTKLPEDQKMAALIHETLHCINNQLSEKDVEFLAQSLFQILKDNF